jgi:hypothetical protein
MDPVTAVGLLASVIQVIDATTTVITTAHMTLQRLGEKADSGNNQSHHVLGDRFSKPTLCGEILIRYGCAERNQLPNFKVD